VSVAFIKDNTYNISRHRIMAL